jgi:hypothetical protein
MHREGGPHTVAMALNDPRVLVARGALPRCVQGQLHRAGAEQGAVFGNLDRVLPPAVVEPGLQVQHELHGSARHPQLPHQPVPVGGLTLDDRHEVLHLADAVGGHEPGDEHRVVREVQLLGNVVVAVRSDPEVATLVGIQQGREHARRIEPRAAEPVHCAVGGDQGSGLQITYESVGGDVRIALRDPSLFSPTSCKRAEPVHAYSATIAAGRGEHIT